MKVPNSLLALLFLPMMVHSQSPMNSGFRMLETGQFADAAVFFHDYLKTDSLNQTALICYARGIGLSGKTDIAKGVLKKLQTRFPNNYEVDLNMAEAHMWSKDFVKALVLYNDLVKRDSISFDALLGYSNAFSESKKYVEALYYVEKALQVSPNNANAMVSRKFMRLGRGGVLVNEGKFDESIALYNLILEENSTDTDALVNKAQALMTAERYIEAKKIYETLVGLPSKKTDGYLGLSMVTYKLKNNDSAFFWAKKAAPVKERLECRGRPGATALPGISALRAWSRCRRGHRTSS
jgi:tetratricopeptide (TPR) repeat protein